MELELGLKFTRVADEFTSDFQITKDRAGPLFLSRETDSMFVLTAHLKGYRRGNIKIDINEDGSLIGISGEKQVQETVMVGWKVYKKETEIKGFKKVFRIPDGVVLDKIKAKFNEDESTLTITMPKEVKGMKGTAIEEVKETQELVKEGSGQLQIVDEKSLKNDEKLKTKIEEDDEKPVLEYNKDDGLKDGEAGELFSPPIHDRVEAETSKEDLENQKGVDEIQERTETKHDQELDHVEPENRVPDTANDIQEERLDEVKQGPTIVESPEEEAEHGEVEEGEHEPRGKTSKMCIPIVAGSALLLSFVVFVIQIIRSKNQTSRRRD